MVSNGDRTVPTKAFSLALHFLIGVVALVMPGTQAAVAEELVSVVSDNANWRSGPGTQYPVEWVLQRGYPLRVIGTRGDWLHVRDFERDEGWIARRLTNDAPHSVVRVKAAHLRNRPSTGSRILARLDYGEVLRHLEANADWVKVRRKSGLRGWVARRLLWGW